MTYNLRSLLLAGLFGFILPLVTIGGLLAVLVGIGWVPLWQSISTVGIAGVTGILHIFGSGNALQGLLIICGVGSLVSMLFESYHLWLLMKPLHHGGKHFTS